MKTRVTEMLGIRYPIVCGGMMRVGRAKLAAAVSNAGGLGIMTALSLPTPDEVIQEVELARSMTDQPIAVNLTILPTIKPVPYEDYAHAIVASGVKIVETAGNNPQRVLPIFKEAGIKVIHKCTSIRHAKKAETLGCDIISVDGFECAGHVGEDDVPNMLLLPLAAEQLSVPFIASGALGNGRQLAAALALGADGINMGTRFLATKECWVHENVKQAMVRATELDTQIVFRRLRNSSRLFKNAVTKELAVLDSDPTKTFEDMKHLAAGARSPAVFEKGELDAGVWSSSGVMGLIHDVPSCAELIERIVADATEIIRKRLPAMVSA
jgi:NADH:quinone reductase (non-electrogenic)